MDEVTETQQHAQGCVHPSHQPTGITLWHEDADAPLTPEQRQAQAAAEQAALIQFGRATAPRALDKPSMAHIDVSWMSDDELERWLDPDIEMTTDEALNLFDHMWPALKEVKANREVVMLGFMNDPAMPPDWVTAIAALPLEDER